MIVGLTTRPVLAAAVAASRLRMLPWQASRRQLSVVGAQGLPDLVGGQILVHGSIGWGDGERRQAAELGLDDSACGRVVARAVVAGFARARDGRVTTTGRRPSWAPDDADRLLDEWPDDAGQVVLLDQIEPVVPTTATGNFGGPWRVVSDLVARIVPIDAAPVHHAPVDPAPVGPAVPIAPARSLEVAFARAAAEADIGDWLIADALPAFSDTWITTLRPVVDDPAEPWPAPAITIERRGDVARQAAELVELIPRLQRWWTEALAELLDVPPASGAVVRCASCEAPSALRSLSGETTVIEGAGFVEELGRRIGFVCSRSRGRRGGGCKPLFDVPVVCSTACERAALADAGRDTSTATSPPEADWQRALEQRRLWKAAGEAQAHDVRRAILIRLASGTPLPAFTEGRS